MLSSFKNLLHPKAEDYYAMQPTSPKGKENRKTPRYLKPHLAVLLKPEYFKEIQKNHQHSRNTEAPSNSDFLTRIEEKYYNHSHDKLHRLSFPNIKTVHEPEIFSLRRGAMVKRNFSIHKTSSSPMMASPTSQRSVMVRNFFRSEAQKKEEELRPSSREEREKRKYLYYPRDDLNEEQKEMISVSISQVKDKYDISEIVGVL